MSVSILIIYLGNVGTYIITIILLKWFNRNTNCQRYLKDIVKNTIQMKGMCDLFCRSATFPDCQYLFQEDFHPRSGSAFSFIHSFIRLSTLMYRSAFRSWCDSFGLFVLCTIVRLSLCLILTGTYFSSLIIEIQWSTLKKKVDHQQAQAGGEPTCCFSSLITPCWVLDSKYYRLPWTESHYRNVITNTYLQHACTVKIMPP